MSKKRIKANLNTRTRWEYVGTPGNYKRVKVTTHRWSLPATPKAYSQMVEQIAELIFVPLGSEAGETNRRAELYLSTIGITPPDESP